MNDGVLAEGSGCIGWPEQNLIGAWIGVIMAHTTFERARASSAQCIFSASRNFSDLRNFGNGGDRTLFQLPLLHFLFLER